MDIDRYIDNKRLAFYSLNKTLKQVYNYTMNYRPIINTVVINKNQGNNKL